jgi:diguanylate cyclase (GGDEF)-like protein/PAS domain S-box-containing protein
METIFSDQNAYRCIAEQAADSIFVTDTQNRVTYQNPEARHVFGFEDAEIIGHSILEKLHHHYLDGTPVPYTECKVYRSAVLGETARDFVWVLYRKDGSSFYASCTSSPLHIGGQHVGALFFATDITARIKTEEALREKTEQLQLATDAAELGLFDYYPQTDELIWSDRVKEHFGLSADTPISVDTFFAGLHPADRARIRLGIADALKSENGGRFRFKYRTIAPVDGKVRWIEERGQVHFTPDGIATRLIGTTMDITERELAEQRLQEAAQHDSLTGLPNRALLFQYAEFVFAQAKRTGADSALLFIDLDRFKPVNDLYGHEVGDKVLQEVARRLQKCTRKEDVVSRLGGDEFIVLLPHIDTAHDPETVARHILRKIGQPFHIGGLALTISASIGISLFREHAHDLESLIRCADLAMYAAKKSGRNNHKLYTPGHDELATNRLQLEIHLKHTLERNGMVLFYQPIIDIVTGKLIGAEALIRLPDENGVMLNPSDFIPIAESAGLIDSLGQWVVTEVCKQHQRWRDAGMPQISIAVNVSAMEFRQKSFASQLAKRVEESGMDPSCLQIEVTESAVMDNIADAIATLREIRAMGIRIALDDFGTGYSSLNHLKNLPLDKLKIDQSFIQRIENDRPNQSITEAIIALGRTLDLQVVGEGIESEEAMDFLRRHGCDQGQGFLFSKPLPPIEFELWHRSNMTRSQH